MFSLTGGEGYH